MRLFASGVIYTSALLGPFLIPGATPPSLCAQSRPTPGIAQLNLDGAYLGIEMEDVTANNMAAHHLSSERGVIVRSVAKGSPAEAANLREDDVVLEFAGFPVWSSMHLARLVQETPPGRKVDLAISRGGKKLNLIAQLGKREPARSDRGMEVIPGDGNRREFRFFGPDGRSFQFGIPDFDSGRTPGPGSADPRGRLGVTLQPLTDQLAEYFAIPGRKGALVTSTTSGSPAEGKLRAGDVIIRAGGKNIDSPEDLAQFVRDAKDGKVDLKVIRDKKEITVTVDLLPSESKGYKL